MISEGASRSPKIVVGYHGMTFRILQPVETQPITERAA